MTPLSKVTPISKFNLVSGRFLWYNVCRITDVLEELRVKSPLTALHRNAHWEPKKNVKPFHCLRNSKRTPLGQLSRATKCTITIIINPVHQILSPWEFNRKIRNSARLITREHCTEQSFTTCPYLLTFTNKSSPWSKPSAKWNAYLQTNIGTLKINSLNKNI